MTKNTKTVLHNVTLSKSDTCLTFVLKRLGEPYNLCTYMSFHEHFQQYPFVRFKDKLQIGDLLLWDKDIKWEWMAVTIKDDKILWENVPRGFHFGIYEGENLFSDCTRLVVPPHPTLRMRDIASLQKTPDWILRLNDK
jgi:hypothetical protein